MFLQNIIISNLKQYIIAHQPWTLGLSELPNLGGGRNRLEKSTDPSSAPLTPLYSYYNLNKNTDITSKKFLTAETHSSTIFALEDKPAAII